MITSENIATATIAKIFGSELLHLQSKATTDSGAPPQMVKIDPKQFLYDEHQKRQKSQQTRAEEQRMLQALQQQAEQAYPMEASLSLPPVQQLEPVQQIDQVQQIEQVQPVSSFADQFTQPVSRDDRRTDLPLANVWERIATSLEKIATELECSKVTMTKSRQPKRKKLI